MSGSSISIFPHLSPLPSSSCRSRLQVPARKRWTVSATSPKFPAPVSAILQRVSAEASISQADEEREQVTRPLHRRSVVFGGRRTDTDKAEAEDSKRKLPTGLWRESLPRHVAMIMDGNSRWSAARGLPVSAGHEAGYRALRNVVELSAAWGIRVLTVFAFSCENWLRPKAEVDFLMRLFEGVLRENLNDFLRQGVRLYLIGDSSKLPVSLRNLVKEAEELTRSNTRIELVVAVSYSGRADIAQACRKIAHKVKDGALEPEDISESMIAEELETNCVSEFTCPDLLIRTSGEVRLSNFLLWQSAYTELFFSKAPWPDFGEADYAEALFSYQQRQRRFGRRVFSE